MLGPSAFIMPSSRTLLVPPPPYRYQTSASLAATPPTLIPTPPYRPSLALFHRHLLPSLRPDARPSTPTSIHRRAAPTQGAQLFTQPGTVHPPPHVCARPLRFIMPSSTHTAYPPYRCHTSSPLTAYPRHAYSHTSNAPSPDSVGGVQRMGRRTV